MEQVTRALVRYLGRDRCPPLDPGPWGRRARRFLAHSRLRPLFAREMAHWSRWVGVGAAVGIVVALVPVVRGGIEIENPLRKLGRRDPPSDAVPKLDGIDLLRVKLHPRRVTTQLDGGREAELTLDPELQRVATSLMKRHRVPKAGVVLMEAKTGKLLVYSSFVADGERFDVNVRADAPAASVFKIVTGATLVEKGGLGPQTEQCYHGGKSRIMADELQDDPKRDRWCATLAMAMGRSLNVVFARLAQKHITPEDLTQMGGAFGFGSSLPFPVTNAAPKIEIPADPLEFARSAAGFWHTTLSPLAGASIAQTVANGGVTLEPRIVAKVTADGETAWEDRRDSRVLRRAIKSETASQLTEMMVETVANGSAYKSFHDALGRAYLPGVSVAGKTGTLSDAKGEQTFTWFVGFAPSDKPEVAVSALVVNTPVWKIKGPELARDVLRAYFVKKGVNGVTAP
jgi:cell division protein FtsI/penicillin-binding protein 2